VSLITKAGLLSWNSLLYEPAIVSKFKDKRLLRLRNSVLDAFVGSHEVVHLIPSWRISARQIKAARAILFYGCGFGQQRVKLSIMAEYYPALSSNFANPFVVRRLFAKLEFVFWIVMELH
jgi:hypothetical protein